MVNVDHWPRQRIEKVSREHLHVARKHDKIHLQFTHQRELLCLSRGFRLRRERHMMKRESVATSGIREIQVISNHRHQFAGEFTRAPAERQIVKTMVRLRNKHRDARALRGRNQSGMHAERGSKRSKAVSIR